MTDILSVIVVVVQVTGVCPALLESDRDLSPATALQAVGQFLAEVREREVSVE